jgi:hypothetical protein
MARKEHNSALTSHNTLDCEDGADAPADVFHLQHIFNPNTEMGDRLCALVVRVPGYGSRGSG